MGNHPPYPILLIFFSFSSSMILIFLPSMVISFSVAKLETPMHLMCLLSGKVKIYKEGVGGKYMADKEEIKTLEELEETFRAAQAMGITYRGNPIRLGRKDIGFKTKDFTKVFLRIKREKSMESKTSNNIS